MMIQGKAKLIGAMALGQGIALTLALMLSRLFEPETLGGFQVYASIFVIASILIPLRYESALYEMKDGNRVGARHAMVVSSTVATCILFVIIVFKDVFASHGLDAYLLAAVVLGATFNSFVRIAQALFACEGASNKLAFLNLVRPGAVPAGQILFGFFAASTASLVFGQFIANLLLFLALVVAGGATFGLVRGAGNIPFKKFISVYSSYPKYSLPQNLLFVSGEALLPLLLISKFGVLFGGLYWYAAKVAASPMQVIVESLRPIIYRQVVQAARSSGEDASRLALGMSFKLALPVLLLSLLLYFYGEQFFVILLGKAWVGVSDIASALVFGLIAHAIATPYISVLNMLGMNRQFMIVEFVVLLTRCLAIVFLANVGSVLLVWILAIVGVAFSVVFFASVHLRMARGLRFGE